MEIGLQRLDADQQQKRKRACFTQNYYIMEINDQSQITEMALEKEEEELDFQKCVLFKSSKKQAVARIVEVENNFLNYR